MALVDLKMSKAEQKTEAVSPEPSDYSYGLCITLDTDELEKLGITTLPGVGDECHIRAVGEVTSVSENDAGNGQERSVRVQIQMMELRNEGQEEGEESVAEEEGEDAEATTVMRSTYRGG